MLLVQRLVQGSHGRHYKQKAVVGMHLRGQWPEIHDNKAQR